MGSLTRSRVVLIFCSLMNLIHIHNLCLQYFEFDVTTNVEMEMPRKLLFPSFTICLDLPFDWERIPDVLVKRLLRNPKNNSQWLLNLDEEKLKNRSEVFQTVANHGQIFQRIIHNAEVSLTVAEILNLTKDIKDFIERVRITQLVFPSENSKNGLWNPTKNLNSFPFQVKQAFLKEKQKCFQLYLRDNLAKLIDYDEFRTLHEGILSYLAFKNSFHGYFYITREEKTVSSSDESIFIDPNSIRSVGFHSFETQQMKPPYKTMCRDYKQYGYFSRLHCKNQCLKQQIIKQHKEIHYLSNAYSTDIYPVRHLSHNISLYSLFFKQCDAECFPNDCQSFTYVTRLEDTFHSQNKCAIQWFPSRNPNVRIQTQAAIPLISFLTSLFSTFGFWLGLSFLGSFSIMGKLLSKLSTACRHENRGRRFSSQTQITNTVQHFFRYRAPFRKIYPELRM